MNNVYVASQRHKSWQRFFMPEPFFMGLGISIALLGMVVPAARAECTCLCVEGNVQAVCDNSVEPRPLCGPTWCAPPPDVRLPEPLVASPGQEWLYTSPTETQIGEDTYDWQEFGKEPE
jgi:hypothetical protein